VVIRVRKEGVYNMPHLGPLELVIILVIVLLLFGVGRIGKIAGELGTGIRSFRQGLKSEEKENEAEESSKE
jgi:sec-independent protein translocase protein TatA